MSTSVGPKIQGEVLGINSSVQALAQAIPAVLSGYLAEISIAVPVLVGAGTVFTGALLFWLIYHPGKHHSHSSPTAAVSH